MSTHPPHDKEKDKDKEEYDEDDLELLINFSNFSIGSVIDAGNLGVGK